MHEVRQLVLDVKDKSVPLQARGAQSAPES